LIEIFAVTNRGLEEICATEMARIPGLRVDKIAYRRVHARFGGDARALLDLRTVDDLFIALAAWHEISPHRRALHQFDDLARDLDLWQAVNVRSSLFALGDDLTFSVSANFVGRRNYTADEVKEAIAAGLCARTGWRYRADDRESDINVRVFIEHDHAVVGMRLADRPLYKRDYKAEHVPGSLKPPVAAALVDLARPPAGALLLDPCCGAGTILIEAAAVGLTATGGDQAASAVAAAKQNIAAAGVAATVQEWDLTALPLEAESVDTIVSNLPWGRQVEVEHALADFYTDACAEMARVIQSQGRIVLLTNRPDLVAFPTRPLEQRLEISLFGQQPTVLVFGPRLAG
jgi:23S rRNA G2445 N2-methylase RlmL